MERSDLHDELEEALRRVEETFESSGDGGVTEKSGDQGPTDEELLRSLTSAIRRVMGL